MKAQHTTNLIAAFIIIVTNQAVAADLTIARSGQQAIVGWPQAGTNEFYLQAATNLSAPILWGNTSDPATNGNNLVITNQVAGRGSFYRLQAWEVLFDGTNITAFRAFPTNPAKAFPSNSWVVANGTLATKVVANPTNLLTKTAYGNFELRWNWKTDPNGNSGVFYRETAQSNPVGVSPEYQLLDDANRTNTAPYSNITNQMGAVYGYIGPTNRMLAPTGQWNDCRVIVKDYHVTHWLNGKLIVDYLINSPAWKNVFVQATNSYISFQNIGNNDNGVVPGVIYYRDIKIRRLP